MIRRTTFFFKENYWRVLGLVGLGLEILACAFWQSSPRLAGVLAGVGGSILATVIVTWAGPAGEEVYQSFLRLGVKKFWADRSLVDNDQWVKWLKGAQMRCTLLGHAHGEWVRDDGFAPTLVERLTSGVNVEVFFLDPKGTAAELRHNEDSKGLRDTQRRIRTSIKELWAISEGLKAEVRARLTIYVYNCTPSLGVTWIDNWMLVTHYLPGSINKTSPALLVEFRADGRSPYAVYEANVARIREASSVKITDQNVQRYINE
jgi:hypothetical protein